MATLEKIRSKGGIIVAVVIFVALLAFILTDLLTSGRSLTMSSQAEVANINGKSVSINEFQAMTTEMEEFNRMNSGQAPTAEQTIQLRDQMWSRLVDQTLLDEIYDKLGIAVTSAELMDMVTGNNIHPFIMQFPLFVNQQTGMYDKAQATDILSRKNSDPMFLRYWNVLEKEMMNERLRNKYTNLLKKGMYVTKAAIDAEVKSRTRSVDFDYVMARYTTIPDSTVTISSTEIANYYAKNKEQFKQEASRDFEYITFDVAPTDEDRQAVYETIMKMKPDFSNPDRNAIEYVNLNSDEPYIERNMKAEELSAQLQDFILDASVNDVYGPYMENEAYKMSRIAAINMIPDSVKARHILVQEATPEASKRIADSLMTLINNGADFAQIARDNSKDPGSAINGGDLGWFMEGQMVPEFNNASFLGKKGDIVKVETQYGTHIINIQEQTKPIKKFQVATLEKDIIYSTKTYDNTYQQATKFRVQYNNAEKFNEGVEAENLTKRFGRQVRENDHNVGTLESPRDMVKWAFENKTGAVSPVFECGDQFVVALLTTVSEKGYSSVETVKTRIERELFNKKKGELLVSRFNEAMAANKDMVAIATTMNTSVQNAQDINFASFSVPGAGSEPALVALAVASPVNEISKAVAGTNGVFVVKVTLEETAETNAETIATQLQSNATMNIDYQLAESIKKNVTVKDYRSKFY
ncbi:MAG: SurA N-terminal domain-containing protein [Cytophagaceae bacterium]|jgi:peptidyl-prolyl cis-trans isomerase D|nr:SurA N-terminal domain-containing protein [Cytophagaceae bacterium]